jgi:hypothetical protein
MPQQEPIAFIWVQGANTAEEMSHLTEQFVMVSAYLFGIPLFLIYSRLIYVLVKHKNRFNSAFFRLVVAFGLMVSF